MNDGDRKHDHHPPTLGELGRLILEAQERGEPITLAINGRGGLLVGDVRSIQELFALVDRLESIESVRAGVRYFERGGEGHSFDDIRREIRENHGVPL